MLGTAMLRASLIGLAAAASLAACAGEGSATHVFVKDPHQVWVEAASNNGEEIILPPGLHRESVRIVEGESGGKGTRVISYATLLREPSGSITVDDKSCAPWPTSPLSARGELHIMKAAGEAPFVSDGLTVRVPYLCTGAHQQKVEIDFVTPWTNVTEVRVVAGELPVTAEGSTHPALQREDWRE
jgi:hypothetical protein